MTKTTTKPNEKVSDAESTTTSTTPTTALAPALASAPAPTLVAAVPRAAPAPITREQATSAMNAIDDLRKRLVKEIKSLERAQAKASDLTQGIELRQRVAYLQSLADLHAAFGTAYNLGGY